VVYTNGPIDGVSAQDLLYSIGAYDDGIFYVDRLVGELAAELKSLAPKRRVLLVITSDHGDEFLEHGGLGHGTTVHRELIESFAIFWKPDGGLKRPRHIQQSGTMDIAPTILELVGIETPASMRGASLLRPSFGSIVIAELASKKVIIQDGWGLVRDSVSAEYELEHYLGDASVVAPKELVASLKSRLDGIESSSMERGVNRIEPEVEAQLRALGYVE
jgi:membrane-anchored protein YejM (alkaline phosphatase superfamily)